MTSKIHSDISTPFLGVEEHSGVVREYDGSSVPEVDVRPGAVNVGGLLVRLVQDPQSRGGRVSIQTGTNSNPGKLVK